MAGPGGEQFAGQGGAGAAGQEDRLGGSSPAQRRKRPTRRQPPKPAKWQPTNAPFTQAEGVMRASEQVAAAGAAQALPAGMLGVGLGALPPLTAGPSVLGMVPPGVPMASGAASLGVAAPYMLLPSGHAVPLLAPAGDAAVAAAPGGILGGLAAAPALHQQPPHALEGINQPVGSLLAQLGLSKFAALLEDQEVDMVALRLMSEGQLRGLGLPLGAVVKIQAALGSGGGGGSGAAQ